jgi:mannose-6-phosphate isomerase-like protein (cupin superfamily)
MKNAKQKRLRFGEGFRISIGNHKSQAAEMVIAPGDSEGDAENRHRGADQWLFVVSGKGKAVLGGKQTTLKKGTLLLIEKGRQHEIKNTGSKPLRTLNFYVPPAYTPGGNLLPRARRRKNKTRMAG